MKSYCVSWGIYPDVGLRRNCRSWPRARRPLVVAEVAERLLPPSRKPLYPLLASEALQNVV